jgi:DNA-binding CsgD family transcriptional regulator
LPFADRTLTGTIETCIVAPERTAAAAIARAVQREGLNVHLTWRPLPATDAWIPEPLDLLIVVEPEWTDWEPHCTLMRAALPNTGIVVICSRSRERPQALVWAGADAILFEPGADAIVGGAVRSVLAGYVVLPRALRAGLQPPPLTSRERQMLGLVVEGLTNREIADRIYLAESTVKRHLSASFRKLGVSSRHEAAAAALAADYFQGAR